LLNAASRNEPQPHLPETLIPPFGERRLRRCVRRTRMLETETL